jgi:hypothetical protein
VYALSNEDASRAGARLSFIVSSHPRRMLFCWEKRSNGRHRERRTFVFGIVRQYKTHPEQIHEIVSRSRDRFMPLISKSWGFVAWTLVDAGPTGVITTSVFDNETDAELAAGWVRENQTALALGPPHINEGAITSRHVKEHAQAGYGFVWRYACKPGDAREVAKRIGEALVPLLSSMPGFASYEAIDAGAGNALSFSAFVDRATAEAANRRALAWVKESLAAFVPMAPEVAFGEIKLHVAQVAAA